MGNDEKNKLMTLLNYWIEHNREHSQEFRDWADKAQGFGEPEISKEILQAAQKTDHAGELLSRVLRKLEGKEG